jgi:hypothetical protein
MRRDPCCRTSTFVKTQSVRFQTYGRGSWYGLPLGVGKPSSMKSLRTCLASRSASCSPAFARATILLKIGTGIYLVLVSVMASSARQVLETCLGLGRGIGHIELVMAPHSFISLDLGDGPMNHAIPLHQRSAVFLHGIEWPEAAPAPRRRPRSGGLPPSPKTALLLGSRRIVRSPEATLGFRITATRLTSDAISLSN